MVKKKVKREKVKEKKKVMPLGVKIISIFYYINAIALAILGIVIIFFSLYARQELAAQYGSYLPFIVMGILFLIVIALGGLCFAIGKGLWIGQKWSKTAVVIISSLLVILSLLDIIYGKWSNILGLVFNGIIISYLLFNKKAQKAFS